MSANNIDSPYKGSGGITREQFLFHEMRTTARLMTEGLDDKDIIDRIIAENLFQNPTERMLKNLANVCLKRLHGLNSDVLVEAVAKQPMDIAKQVCLYAMMRQYRLVWDFMITVIGEKYRVQDLAFSKMDINIFFMQLREQDDYVAGWSEGTINKIRQVLVKVLVETEYLDNIKAERINPVLLCSLLENKIIANNDIRALTAFNCFQ